LPYVVSEPYLEEPGCPKNVRNFPFFQGINGAYYGQYGLFYTHIYSPKKGVNSRPENLDKIWKVRYNNKLRLLSKENKRKRNQIRSKEMQHKSITLHVANFILVLVLIFMVVSLTGCMSSNRKNIEAFNKPDELDVTCKSYVLQPPDEIEVRCEAVSEIDLQRQRIRPDGKIGFEGIGEIYVAGKTPSEVSELIKEKVLGLYTLTGDNPIDVRVVQFESKVYYVLGQVDRPGPKDYTGRDTVLSAVAEAGLIPRSWEERTQVIRPSKDKNIKPKIFELNVDRMIAHGDASKNVLLQEGDIVFIPPTILGALGLMLEEALSPVRQIFSTANVVAGAPAAR